MFIGLDAHKATISVAVAQGKRGGEVWHRGAPKFDSKGWIWPASLAPPLSFQ